MYKKKVQPTITPTLTMVASGPPKPPGVDCTWDKLDYWFLNSGNYVTDSLLTIVPYEEPDIYYQNPCEVLFGMRVDCSIDCINGQKCFNQRFRDREWVPNLIVKKTPDGSKGLGVYAPRNLEKDLFIIEYLGEIITQAMREQRDKDLYSDSHNFYSCDIPHTDLCIDATVYCCNARFMNQSCAPTCYAMVHTVDGQPRVGLFAKRNIISGEELTWYYNSHSGTVCLCGASNCDKTF